jgi:hypothetical protein
MMELPVQRCVFNSYKFRAKALQRQAAIEAAIIASGGSTRQLHRHVEHDVRQDLA